MLERLADATSSYLVRDPHISYMAGYDEWREMVLGEEATDPGQETDDPTESADDETGGAGDDADDDEG